MEPTSDVTSTLFYTRDPNLLRRNEIYLKVLELGLLFIRGAGYDADSRRCEIEADHLHNIPSYIAGGDAAHHLYYLTSEIFFYLRKIDLKVPANMDLVRRYVPLWKELETLVPVEGSPWADKWRELKAGGWNYGLPAGS